MKIFKNLRKAYREERKYRDNVMETIDAMGIRGIFMAMFTGKCQGKGAKYDKYRM